MADRKNGRHGARVNHATDTTTPGSTTSRANARRIALGLTLQQLADRAGLAIRTITRCLREDTSCDVRTYRRVATALDVDPLDLWPHLASHPRVLVRKE
jgi:transcriptional regulator with XRE-family HTH domain